MAQFWAIGLGWLPQTLACFVVYAPAMNPALTCILPFMPYRDEGTTAQDLVLLQCISTKASLLANA
jgi:hypothetical protein